LPACPKCRSLVKVPIKTFTYYDGTDRKNGVLEQDVGFYECPRCSEKFPYVYGRQKLRIIPVSELERSEKAITGLEKALTEAKADGQQLQSRLSTTEAARADLSSEVLQLREALSLRELENRVEGLRHDVSQLRMEKGWLEAELSV